MHPSDAYHKITKLNETLSHAAANKYGIRASCSAPRQARPPRAVTDRLAPIVANYHSEYVGAPLPSSTAGATVHLSPAHPF